MQYARTSRIAPRAHLASLGRHNVACAGQPRRTHVVSLCRCAQANQTDWIPAGDCPMRTRARARSAPRAASDSEGAGSERACVANSRTRGSQCPHRTRTSVSLPVCPSRARAVSARLFTQSANAVDQPFSDLYWWDESVAVVAEELALARYGGKRVDPAQAVCAQVRFAPACSPLRARERGSSPRPVSPPPLHAPLLSGPPPPPSSSDWQWLENGARVRINLENGPTYSWSMVDQAFGHPSRVCLAANLTNFLSTYWPTAAGCKSAARPSMARGHLGISASHSVRPARPQGRRRPAVV